MGPTSTRLLSGFMAYEYRCVWVKDDKINPKLKEWADAGWELHTATAIMTGIGKYAETYNYLYFRRAK
jgi:hypothetical protein